MKYSSAIAFRTALEQRLQRMAVDRSIPLARLRKLVVFDRLMARLIIVAPNRWILKGAVALNYRKEAQFRTTKDLDIGRHDNEEATTQDFIAAQSLDLNDYFTFIIERTPGLDSMEDDVAVRYHVTASIAGRRFDDVTVDVGFDDPTDYDPEMLHGPDLLGFADITPTQVPALPLEQHIAEKLHAYTRTYGDGKQSSRVKDLIDLVMISSGFEFKAKRLLLSLQSVFSKRATHELPTAIPAPPAAWDKAYGRMANEVGLNQDMNDGYKHVQSFLDPVLSGKVKDNARWAPALSVWK